jgi:hypothetical protein
MNELRFPHGMGKEDDDEDHVSGYESLQREFSRQLNSLAFFLSRTKVNNLTRLSVRIDAISPQLCQDLLARLTDMIKAVTYLNIRVVYMTWALCGSGKSVARRFMEGLRETKLLMSRKAFAGPDRTWRMFPSTSAKNPLQELQPFKKRFSDSQYELAEESIRNGI